MRLVTLDGLVLEGADTRRTKPLLLLAYLAIEGPKERRHLAELFWMGATDPLNSLSKAINQLNGEAPSAFEADHRQVEATIEMDATELLTRLDAGDLEGAVELYRGPFLRGVYLKDWSAELEEWIYGTREFIAGRVQEAQLRLAERDAASGTFEGAARRAEQAYLLPGAPEPSLETLARLYSLLVAGGNARAKEVAGEAESFGPPLSLTPEQAREKLGQAATPETSTRHNLPPQPTSFIGRSEEQLQLAGLLEDPNSRLVSIVGPGGMGKTRLAIEIASAQLERFTDGVFFVAFAAVSSPNGMVPTIRDELGLQDSGREDPEEHLLDYLSDKTMLLVLDNLEHLVGGAELVRDLWERAPRVWLLVTSRERLNLQAERVLSLSGLITPEGLPVGRADAVELFVNSVRSSGFHLIVDEESLHAVARVCRLVGGLPLAIELAASWVRALPIEEIAREIEGGIDLLEGSTRDLPERHRSVRAVFDHSWSLLTEREQEVLRRLSVFLGGFRREAAAEVTGATLPMLMGLVDKSLLRMSSEGRYDRHPLFIQYTRDKLAEHPEEQTESKEKHARYFLRLVRELEGDLRTRKRLATLKVLNEEQANVRQAWFWALEHTQVEEIRTAAFAIGLAFDNHKQDSIALFDHAIAVLADDDPSHHPALGNVFIQQAENLRTLPDVQRMSALVERGLETLRPLGETRGLIRGHFALGAVSQILGRPAEARRRFQEALDLAQQYEDNEAELRLLIQLFHSEQALADVATTRRFGREVLDRVRRDGDLVHLAVHLHLFGIFLVRHDDLEQGYALLQESCQLVRELGMLNSEAFFLNDLAFAAFKLKDYQQAGTLAHEALRKAERHGSRWAQGKVLTLLSRIAIVHGDFDRAWGLLRRSLQLSWANNLVYSIMEGLVVLSGLLLAEGDTVKATEILNLVLAKPGLERHDEAEARRLLVDLRKQLVDEEFLMASERGGTLEVDRVVEEFVTAFPGTNVGEVDG